MNFLKRYWGTLRRLRILHVLHNVAHYGKLKRNKDLYRKYGVHKSVVSSLAYKDITVHSGESPWLDSADAVQRLQADPRFANFPAEYREQLLQWPDNGYLILRGFVSPEHCDKINADLQRLIDTREVDFDYTNSRVMNAWRNAESINSVIRDPKLIDFLSFILNREVLPFQTISFLKGSQQRTHSDSIHMTTEPLGYLLAIWVALEDVTADCGPLHYFPGSQKLPYVLSEDFENKNTSLAIDGEYYGRYEDHIGRMVAEKKLEKKIFLAKKGDLLVWHANLLHGGEKVTREDSTRKSLVAHYFCKGDVICYHEITQRPAVLPE